MGLEGDYLHFWGSNTQTNSRKEGGIVTKITKQASLPFFFQNAKRGKKSWRLFYASQSHELVTYTLLTRKSDAMLDDALYCLNTCNV